MNEKKLIMVVDDDMPILVLMKSILREFGFESLTVASGQEAIREAVRQRPRMIFLDRNMPDVSGEDVIRELRLHEEHAHTPIFMLSGEPLEASEIAAIGANGALLKPFELTELIALIRQHVDA